MKNKLKKKLKPLNAFKISDIPKGTWNTIDNQVLVQKMGSFEFKRKYMTSNDTLKMFHDNGYSTIFIKMK